MSSFQRIVAVKPSLPFAEDLATKSFWKKFKNSSASKEVDSITSLSFDPLTGSELFSTASTRFSVFKMNNMERIKSVSKSTDVIGCIGFRCDGKLFALGNSSGAIQIFDSSSKKLIRKLGGHSGPVRGLAFTPDKTHLYSVSDDLSIKYWDIPTEQEILSVPAAHKDYIRTCALSESGKVLITGSYDHSIKIWDTQDLSLILELDNLAPVESLLLSKNGGLLFSSGSNFVKAWDLTCGGSLLHTIYPHQKTITSLCFSSDNAYIITGALDRHAKVIDIRDYSIVFSFRVSAPIMCVACNRQDSAVAFGLSNGQVVMKTRNLPGLQPSKPAEPTQFDFIMPKKQSRLSQFEKSFKSFKFRDTLDDCLALGNPQIFASCIIELMAFDGLAIALSGRSEDGLVPIIRLLGKIAQTPEYAPIAIEVTSLLLDMYGHAIQESNSLHEITQVLARKVYNEIEIGKSLSKVSGQIEMIISSKSPVAI